VAQGEDPEFKLQYWKKKKYIYIYITKKGWWSGPNGRVPA
jgi:hypothetical protein